VSESVVLGDNAYMLFYKMGTTASTLIKPKTPPAQQSYEAAVKRKMPLVTNSAADNVTEWGKRARFSESATKDYEDLVKAVEERPLVFTDEYKNSKSNAYPAEKDIESKVVASNMKKGVYECVMRLWKEGRVPVAIPGGMMQQQQQQK